MQNGKKAETEIHKGRLIFIILKGHKNGLS